MPELPKIATKAEVYQSVRDQVVHEDNLVNQRFTWMLTSTGFLMAGFFLLLTSVDKFTEREVLFGVMLLAICLVGIAFCYFLKIEITKNANAYINLRKFWYERFPEEGENEGYNFLDKFRQKEFPDVHHNIPEVKQKMITKLRYGVNVVSITLMMVWLGFSVFSSLFIYNSFHKKNPIKQDTYQIIRRSTLGKDTTIYIDTLYLPKK